MKVKFLNDMGDNKKGTTKEVDDARGNYWLQMGIVENVEGSAKKDLSNKTKQTAVKTALTKKSASKKTGKK